MLREDDSLLVVYGYNTILQSDDLITRHNNSGLSNEYDLVCALESDFRVLNFQFQITRIRQFNAEHARLQCNIDIALYTIPL